MTKEEALELLNQYHRCNLEVITHGGERIKHSLKQYDKFESYLQSLRPESKILEKVGHDI